VAYALELSYSSDIYTLRQADAARLAAAILAGVGGAGLGVAIVLIPFCVGVSELEARAPAGHGVAGGLTLAAAW
jgi:hypothetical protein